MIILNAKPPLLKASVAILSSQRSVEAIYDNLCRG